MSFMWSDIFKTPCSESEKVPKITIGNKDLKLRQDVIMSQFCKKTCREIAELKEKPLISNKILQVVCVGNNYHYLDYLLNILNFKKNVLKKMKNICYISPLSLI
jgi:hypothetical protein